MLEERIEIRWRDMDAYGHVNNAVYLTYLEEARDAWVLRVLDGTVCAVGESVVVPRDRDTGRSRPAVGRRA